MPGAARGLAVVGDHGDGEAQGRHDVEHLATEAPGITDLFATNRYFGWYHEPIDELSDETRDMHRAITSLMEEFEAVDWYNQRVDACKDPELRAILEQRVELHAAAEKTALNMKKPLRWE